MKKTTRLYLSICICVLLVLAASAFVDTDRFVSGGTPRVIGNYPSVAQVEESLPEDEPRLEETAQEAPDEADASSGGFLSVLSSVNNFVNSRIAWGLFMCGLLVLTGAILSVRTGAVQITHFGEAMKNTLGKLFKKQTEEEKQKSGITPFQALCTALAATVGTGNIAGVTGAIVLGGPGAVFWMWIAALVGMCTKYAEIVLALKYRVKDEKGEWMGGPMYTITRGMGEKWKWLAVLFCIFGTLASFGIGSMTQTNTIATTLSGAAYTLSGGTMSKSAVSTMNLIIGLCLAGVTALVIFGGIQRLGKVTEKIVPIMSAFYVIGSLVVIILNGNQLGMVFGSIFQAAFTGEAVLGGVGGFMLMNTIKRGVGRGVFTNEAGMGSAPIAHAASQETDPVKQGFYGILEVFLDTFVVCTMTSLVVLTSGVVPFGDSSLAGAQTTVNAFATVFGDKLSAVFIALAILFFAFSTVLSWSYYGKRCFTYLTKGKYQNVYYAVFLFTVVAGATMKLELVWNLSDTFNGLMTVPNLISLLCLSGVVAKATKEYFDGKKNKIG